MNIKPISKNLSQKIKTDLYLYNTEEARNSVARAWRRILPFNGSQLTCSRRDAEAIYGKELTELLIEAEIFDFWGGANDQVVRRF